MAATLGFRVSRGVLSTISPPIPQAYQWATRYTPTPTRPLLDMSQGVPGIPPPQEVQDALGVAASSPTSFGYSRWDGEPALRKALVGEMKVMYGQEADVHVDDIALTAGCNLAFVATVMSLADAGDEVVLPVPWYFNHQMSLNLLGIKVIPLHTLPEDGFTPSVDRCRMLITPTTKAIVLVTPNNPTGATYSPSLLAAFANLAREKNVALIVDETYRDFVMSVLPPHNLFSPSEPAWRQNFIHLFSFSKSYCLPGHRLGAIAASPVLLTSIKTVLDCLQICPPRPVQLALAPLLSSLRIFVQHTAKAVDVRHLLFKQSLPPNWRIGAQGGYFAFVRHPYVRVSARDVSRRLAVQMGVVTLPSAFFCEEERREQVEDEESEGAVEKWDGLESEKAVEEDERWIRFSVANVDDDKVRRVCERLGESEQVFGWELDAVSTS
ncbi:pyridoxal phosphate-dependent transferase [Crucibulum laeve]|uniref:Pyridoxal phosphate-dependent transferase n=1 Tax=Crucibulum laeve TaxID=68775 RepID=A0A5C3MAI3_9AGAR|nr:pyridoxal phosphate-dependent transferase [Crucibulum laeve]